MGARSGPLVMRKADPQNGALVFLSFLVAGRISVEYARNPRHTAAPLRLTGVRHRGKGRHRPMWGL